MRKGALVAAAMAPMLALPLLSVAAGAANCRLARIDSWNRWPS